MDAREVVCEILRRADADVATAKSAREASDYLSKNMPDVLVSDLAMSGLDGYSRLETLRQFPAWHGGYTPAIADLTHLSDGENGKADSNHNDNGKH